MHLVHIVLLSIISLFIQPDTPPTFQVETGLAYNQDARQQLDLYLPPLASDEQAPLVILWHGGGFRFEGEVEPLAHWLVQQRFAVVTPTYRLTPGSVFPAQIEDAFCALGWVEANAAAYQLDLDRVILVGESAGGNLALMLGAINPQERATYAGDCPTPASEGLNVRGVAAYYPMTALGWDEYGPILRYIYGSYAGLTAETADLDAELARTTPLPYLDGSEPPTLIMYGLTDPVLPVTDSTRLADALGEVGVPYDIYGYTTDEHAFIAQLDSEVGAAAADRLFSFLIYAAYSD